MSNVMPGGLFKGGKGGRKGGRKGRRGKGRY